MKRQSIPLLTVAAISVLSQLTFAAPPRYEVIDLGTLGGDQSGAIFINDLGQIVGSAYNQQGNRRATLFDSTGSGNNIDLGTLGGINSVAWAINCSGQIVGFAENQQGYGRATLFDPTGSGKNIDLGTLGELRSNALSINDRGQIVGSARNEQGYQRATLFDPTGGGNNIDLGTLGGIHSKTRFINDRGQIVGNARIPRGYSHATLFDQTGGGNNIDLGTLGGSSSNVHSINNLGQIVGWAANDSLDNRACLFDPTGGGKNIELGTLGGRLSWALSINDLGQIVGAADNQLRDARATLFDPTGNGNNIDLNNIINPTSGWILTNAFCINNNGWIVGNRFNQDGQGRAFLMKPILPKIIYVDDDASGANDGSSWADAFNYLQDALTAAWSGDEIRVAQGTYKPDQGAGITPGDREATFQLISGVTLKGGYAGLGEPNPNTRDIDLYETILSGDVMGNDREVSDPCDLLNDPCRADNSYHVVTSYENDTTAVLDGFTITAGNANYKFDWRRDRRSQGGGMYNESGSPTVIKCNFRLNSARRGGGMFNSNQDDICNPSLNECTFYKNFAQNGGGGGMYNYGNYGYYRRGPYPKLVNCIFSKNSTEHNGGGMCNWDCSPTLTDCIFINNSALKAGGGLCNDGACDTKIINCKFIYNLADSGGGMYNWGDPEYECYPSLNNCIFSHNSACSRGGGLYNYGYCDPTITNCSFITNTAIFGGGMADDWTASPVLINCLYSANTAQYGGGLYNNGSRYYLTGPKFTNCTFTQNSANSGTALACDSQKNEYRSTILMANCILWDGGNEIWNNDNSVITISYSDVQGSRPGEGNIDADPCFAAPGYWDANGVWISGDYHLLPSSPCIDAGDPNYVAEPNETDLDGKPRIISGRIDMGAYESPVPAEVRIVPRTINLTSKGKWITCYIWLGEDYDVADIDPNSVLLENEIQPDEFSADEEQQVAVAKFSREDVQPILEVGDIDLTIIGWLTDRTLFEGRDVIRVINKGGKK